MADQPNAANEPSAAPSAPFTTHRTGLPPLFSPQHRSPGPHVSDIITAIRVRSGQISPRDPNAPRVSKNMMQLGKALETSIRMGMCEADPHRYREPPECQLNGVYGHSDILIDGIDERVVEVKLKWASDAGTDDPDNPVYYWDWLQVKAYCLMEGYDTAELIVVFVNAFRNGDVVCHRFTRRFTLPELQLSWQLLEDAKRLLCNKQETPTNG